MLDVAVDDAFIVDVLHGPRDLPKEVTRISLSEPVPVLSP